MTLVMLLVGNVLPQTETEKSEPRDSVSVRNPEAPKKSTGEILLDIPSTILKTPVYIVEGITWGCVQAINLPIVKKLIRFDNPRAPFYLVGGYGSNKGFSGGTGFGFYNGLVPDDMLKLEWYLATHKYQSYRLKYYASNLFGDGGQFRFRAE